MHKSYVIERLTGEPKPLYFSGYKEEEHGSFTRLVEQWQEEPLQAEMEPDVIDSAVRLKKLKSANPTVDYRIVEVRVTLAPMQLVTAYTPTKREPFGGCLAGGDK